MQPLTWFFILVVACGSLVLIVPLLLILSFIQNLRLVHRNTKGKLNQVRFNSQESVVLPYDPCVSITPDLYSSTAVTTCSSVMNSPCDAKRHSIVTEYFQTVLGLEKVEPTLPPDQEAKVLYHLKKQNLAQRSKI